MLERLPAWATTGVGSLPFTDPQEAAAHAVAAYDLPFCPQLPLLEGDMVAEWLGADPRRCGWSPERDCERPRAWDAWLAALAAAPPAHRVVKLQVTGPTTLACALMRAGGEPPARRDAQALAGELAAWLAANAAAQVRALAERGLDALLVVDEPALHHFGLRGVERAWEPLRAVAPAWGLHLCCGVPWDVVERAAPDLLSFDLAADPLHHGSLLALERLRARGTTIAWGALAAHRREDAGAALARLRAAGACDADGRPPGVLTASCGTGRLLVGRERGLAAELRALRRACGDAAEGVCKACAMTRPPQASVLEPEDVAIWLDVDLPWVMRAIAEDGLPVLGHRSDGVPLLCADEIRAWLRRPSVHDDAT